MEGGNWQRSESGIIAHLIWYGFLLRNCSFICVSVSCWNTCGTSFLRAQSKFRLEEGKQMAKNSAWLLHSIHALLWV